ncbi:hypothetical protein M758_1G255700 [Ceratodon purpureus]|nr:hypothetical protein M758_1G255700 [Ceratodon purpureus]
MSDSELGSELVVAGPGPLLRLLVDIHEVVVRIEHFQFICSAYPFVHKSSSFRNAIQEFKKSNFNVTIREDNTIPPRQERPLPTIELVIPGGIQTFEYLRWFCYDSSLPITKENVLNLLGASSILGFTEDVAPDNLHSRCQRFIEEESKNHGFQGTMSILAHYDAMDSCDRLINDLEKENFNLLINKLAKHAVQFQNSDDKNTCEIVEFLLDLTKLYPEVLDAILQEFERLGVNMVGFFWCTESSTNLDILLGSDEDSQSTARCMIFSYFSDALDKCIAAGEVPIDRVDPRKLVMLLYPGIFRRPMLSGDAIKDYVSSRLSQLNGEDILGLHPRVVVDLVSTAVSASKDTMSRTEEMQHLGDLIDGALIFEAERNPWDGSTDSKENFKEMAECVPLNERESHDLLYDAVESFLRLFTQEEAEDIWNMVDLDKLSEAKFEAAIDFTLSHRDNYYVRLLRRRQDNHLSLKRKLSVLEENETKRKSRRIHDCCGTPFTVFVRSLDGSLLSLRVESHATTVNRIKETIIAKTQCIPSERFWWPVYRGQKLIESHNVAFYGIKKDCTLYIKVLLVDVPEMGLSPSTSNSKLTGVFVTESPCVCVCGCT